MVGYSVIESAVVARLIAHFPGKLDAALCRAGDLDAVLESVIGSESDFGCYIDYNSGGQRLRDPFKKEVWAWTMVGVFFVRYNDSVEANLREVLDELPKVFENDHTLGGVAPLVRLINIGDAEPGGVNDILFYWLPFAIEAIDR